MNDTKQMLDEFVERLKTAAGANLESVVLYGSASSGNGRDRYSDVNLLCVVADASGAELAKIAPVVTWWTGKQGQRPPLLFTLEELRRSADVFAIEMLDMKARHSVLAGQDVLTAIDVPMNLHRVQVEHDLRTVHLKLRQHYLLARHTEQELQQVLAKSVSSVVTLLRHALIAVGETALPEHKREMIARAEEVFHVNAAPFLSALDLREDRRLQAGIAEVYEQYVQSLAAVIRAIDEVEPKKHWHKAV
jgi:predicted nucleotidyltransferase